jgi:hypothetical protein
VVLDAPRFWASKCEDLILRARTSGGKLGRQVLYKWEVTIGTTEQSPEYKDYHATLSRETFPTIAKGSLTKSETIKVKVTAKNAAGKETTKEISIVGDHEVDWSFTVTGQPVFQASKGNTYEVVISERCENSQARTYTYAWEFSNTSPPSS